MTSPSLLDCFPYELILHVMEYLSTRDLAAFSLTSKRAKQAASRVLFILPSASEEQRTRAIELISEVGTDEGMSDLIKNGMRIIQKSPVLQWDSLMNACAVGFINTVRLLLDAGISPNVEEDEKHQFYKSWSPRRSHGAYWTSALMAARYGNYFNIVKLLVSAGLDLKRFDTKQSLILLFHCEIPNYEISQYLVDHGLDIHRLDERHNTLLHNVFDARDEQLLPSDVGFLLDNGLEVSKSNQTGVKPLSNALKWSGKYDALKGFQIVKLMLKGGAQANELCNEIQRPLHAAAMNGSVQIVELLLQEGANPNNLNLHGYSPLYTVGYFGDRTSATKQSGVLAALLKGGASLTIHLDSTSQLLLRALMQKWRGCVRMIHDSPQALNNELACPELLFIAAAALGNVFRMKQMLESGLVSDVNIRVNNHTALIEAARWESKKAIEYLVPLVADLNAQDPSAHAALYTAISGNSEEIIRILLSRTNAHSLLYTDSSARNPLTNAVHRQSPHVLTMVMERMLAFPDQLKDLSKAILNNMVNRESTFLRDNTRSFDVLLEYLTRFKVILDARGETFPNKRITLLTEAIKNDIHGVNLKAIALKLIDSDLPVASPDSLAEAAASDDASYLRAFIRKDSVDLDVTDSNGRSAVSAAVSNNRPENFRLLVEAGASIAVPAVLLRRGWSPIKKALLQHSAFEGYKDIVEILLGQGIRVNTSFTKQRTTALMLAASMGHTDTVRLLLDHGAVVHMSDTTGCTALHWACIRGHADIATLLLDFGAQINACTTRIKPPVSWNKEKSPGVYERYLEANDTFPGCATLAAAVWSGNGATVQVLLDRGAHKELTRRDSRYLMHLAAHRNAAQVIRVLVQAGCDSTLADGAGLTPLHYSADDGPTIAALYSGSG